MLVCLQRQRPASSLSMPQSGPLGTLVSPNSAPNNGQSPLNQQPTSPRKTMHPISTKPPKQITSPRNLNNSQTLLPHVTTSRPGSPIAAGSHTGIHVTSRVAQQQDGSQGVRPPPLHMMLHNTGRAPAVCCLHISPLYRCPVCDSALQQDNQTPFRDTKKGCDSVMQRDRTPNRLLLRFFLQIA